MNRFVLATLTALALVVGISLTADDAQANHGYGCSGGPVAACSAPELASYDAGCSSAAASCAGEHSVLRGRAPVRRILRGAAAVAVAPVRAINRARFFPGRSGRRFGCG